MHAAFDHNRYETPKELLAWLSLDFAFELDAAADATNKKFGKYFADAFSVENWREHARVIFCNPPYSKVRPWYARCYKAAQQGCDVVLLILTPNGELAWHDFVIGHATRVIFIAGRVPFIHPLSKAPHKGNRFGSVVVVFKHGELDKRPCELYSVRYKDIVAGSAPGPMQLH